MSRSLTNIAIFGATSAIAEQTAYALAAPGTRFFLAARNSDKMQKVAAELKLRGAAVVAQAEYDFARGDGLTNLAETAAEDLGDIDIALIAYGTLSNQSRAETDPAYATGEITLNYLSPALLAQAIAGRMAQRGHGFLAVISSVAGDRGRGRNYIYGSAKGGLGLFLQGLAHRLHGTGVQVLDIRPGLVVSPMTQAIAKNTPLWAKPDVVGAAIAARLQARKAGRMYVPGFWRLIMLIARNIPTPIFHKTRL
jgi:decaprenylphospho-beta-D-erythro-pentofuranosid-2-ulose 2-reductase